MVNEEDVEVFWTRGDIHSRVHLAMTKANLVNKKLEIEELFPIYKICFKMKHVLHFLENAKLPIVVKADGLAAGKGVSICKTKKEVISCSDKIFKGKFKSSNKLVLEEFLEGEEASYFLIVDNNNLNLLENPRTCKKDENLATDAVLDKE